MRPRRTTGCIESDLSESVDPDSEFLFIHSSAQEVPHRSRLADRRQVQPFVQRNYHRKRRREAIERLAYEPLFGKLGDINIRKQSEPHQLRSLDGHPSTLLDTAHPDPFATSSVPITHCMAFLLHFCECSANLASNP
jgi:hypothetical protein